MRFLKDYLFTDNFLIRGHVKTGEHRLSTFLNKTHKRFLDLEEATLIRHDGSGRIHAPKMQVRIHDILFAYESEDTGDDVLKSLAAGARDEIRMTACFNDSTSLQITGNVHRRVFDSTGARQHDFIVVIKPELRELAGSSAPDYDTLRNMPYAIVNKNRIAFLFQCEES